MEGLLKLAQQLLSEDKPIPVDLAAKLIEAGFDVEELECATPIKE